MKNKNGLKKKLNLNYLDLTNKVYKSGFYDFPELLCPLPIKPDYIALYTQPSEYHKTKFTCVSFYNYDNAFDGKEGLYNAIYYNDKKLLQKYKERFKGVRFFIAPDYSLCGDIDTAENIYRTKKARIVSLWLTLELKAIVIPNISYSSKKDFAFFLDGILKSEYVAFSTKGVIRNSENRKLFYEALRVVVDNLDYLKGIVVYDVCQNNDEVFKLFDYAIKRNVEIIVPDNSLKIRNRILNARRNEGKIIIQA